MHRRSICRFLGRVVARCALVLFMHAGSAVAFAFSAQTAAIVDPVLCMYAQLGSGYDEAVRVAGSDLANPDALEKVPSLQDAMAFVRGWRATVQYPENPHPNEIASNSVPALFAVLNNVAKRCRFRPDGLYVFFRDRDSFSLVITGAVDPAAWRQLFVPSRIIDRVDGFAVVGNLHETADNPTVLHVGMGYLLICPANLEGTLLDNIVAGRSPLGEKWTMFGKMLSLSPVVAIDADVQGLLAACVDPALSARKPYPLANIAVFRLIVAPQVVKAQFATDDDAARQILQRFADDLVARWRDGATASSPAALRGLRDSLKVGQQGRSVIVEGSGLNHGSHVVSGVAVGCLAALTEPGLAAVMPR